MQKELSCLRLFSASVQKPVLVVQCARKPCFVPLDVVVGVMHVATDGVLKKLVRFFTCDLGVL